MSACSVDADSVQITYDMTRLQRLDTPDHFLVSLNSIGDVDPARSIEQMTYDHPQFTPQSVAAQALLPPLNDGVTAFAGAYFGWGFHEDGALSGLRAAESLGGAW
jgi:predicted NAD/FAD-binding protein